MKLHKILISLLFLTCFITGRAVELASYEYWIDDGYDNRQTVNSTLEEINASVNVADLKNGVHFFNIRFTNTDSEVSSPIRYIFYIPDANSSDGKLIGYEYWLDDNYESRKTSNSDDENQSFAIDVSSLASGVHFLNYRAFADGGVTGSLTRYLFYIPDLVAADASLCGYEYWLDDDYDSRVSADETGEDQTFAIDVSSLASGVHFLNYRAFADGEVTGSLIRYLFYMPDDVGSSGFLSGYEYWLDDDYDARMVVQGSSEEEIFMVDVSALISGVHFLNHRAFTVDGDPGIHSRYIFYIPDNIASAGSPIIGYEYSFNDNVTYVPITPCEEYEMKATAIPMPDIKESARIGTECSFSFADGKATMSNNANVSFLLRFRNAGGEISMPICQEYNESYTISKEIENLQLQKSILLDKVTSGDFQAVRFDIPSNGVYYLRSTQACEMYILDANGKRVSSIGSEALLKTFALSVTSGHYYGIIFNTPVNEENPEKQVGLRFMATNNSVPTPEIKYENEIVSITCIQDDAVIYYTTDGSMPDETKTLYTKPFELKYNAEVKAIAKAADYADSFIASLKIDSYKVETPEIQFTNLKIYITCATPDAKIYYTIDGSDPVNNGQLYMSAIPMTSNCTVKAVAKRENFHNSEIAQYILDISNVKCGTPTLTINGNLLSMSTITEGATIHYTIDGSNPSNRSTAYTSPILLENNGVYKAIAIKGGEIDSDIAEVTIDWFQAETPAFSYSNGFLSITCKTSNNTIYYEIGGTDPNKASNRYTSPIRLDDNRIVKAFAAAPGFNDSETVSYLPSSFTCEAPQVKFDGRSIELITSTSGATIYYTIDGSNPGVASEIYSGKTILPGLCTVKAIAVMENMNNSPVTTYILPCYYNGDDVYVKDSGKMSKAFEWCGGTIQNDALTIHGSLDSADFEILRSLQSLRHLDLKGVNTASVPDEAFKGMRLLTLTMPECGFSAGHRLLSGCKDIAAVIWNSNTVIPLDIFDGLELPNMLLYVKYAAVANANFGNIIVDNVATSINLSDADHSNFYCPIEFTARKISYTHNYSQRSGFERCTGWESIALPFSPTDIHHETRGSMSPFAAGKTGKKQFWLCELTSIGFVSAARLEANKPYIIAMPNSDNYSDEYILAGNVTFSGSDVIVQTSDDLTNSSKGENLFVPNFVTTDKDMCMTLNVGEFYNGHPEGSLFVLGLRECRPFEAYVTNHSANIFKIGFDSSDVYVLPETGPVSVVSQDRILTVSGLSNGDVVEVFTMQGILAIQRTAYDVEITIENAPLGPALLSVTRAGRQIYREKHIIK